MATRARSPEIPLDQQLLDLLSSRTRRRILFTLQERPHTVSELSEELDLSKPTVHEHLDKLEDADLVLRREDDRLWVYYELTSKGDELITPSSSQLRVVVGVALAALILGAVAATALPAPGFGLEGDGGDDGAPGDRARFLPDLSNDMVLGHAGAPLDVGNLSGLSPDAEAYLVPEDEADRLLSRDPGRVDVIELRVTGAGENRTLRIPEGTPGGTYRLYVVDGAETNVNRMPVVTVVPATADVEPSTWWRGLDEDVQVTLPPGPIPRDGRLLVSSGNASGAATVPLEDGAARIPPGTLQGLEPGRYDLRVVADDRSVPLETRLEVRDPGGALAPRHLAPVSGPEGKLSFDDEVPARHVPPPFVVDGEDADLQRGLGNTWAFDLPAAGGAASAALGRLEAVDVVNQPPTKWRLEDRGDRWTLTLEDGQGAPVDGAVVRLDGTARDVTDEAGEAAFAEPAEGPHHLRVVLEDEVVVDQPLEANGTGIRPLAPTASVTVQDVTAGYHVWRVHVEVSPDVGRRAGPGTLVALEGDRLGGATPVPADAGAPYRAVVPASPGPDEPSLHVELWAPTPPIDASGTASRVLEADAVRDEPVVTAGQVPVSTPSPPPWEGGEGPDPWTELRIDPADAALGGGAGGVTGPGAAVAAAAMVAAAAAWARAGKGP